MLCKLKEYGMKLYNVIQVKRVWYETKWTPDTKVINPCWTKEWINAVKYSNPLP
jgi:hypothetical protein